jgi:predicted amidohydrolase
VIFPELSLTGYELEADPVSVSDEVLAPLIGACAEAASIALVGAPVEEDGLRFIAALRVDGRGATVAYRKSHLGGDEVALFAPGGGPTVLDVDGWRVGVAICKDTGVVEHTAATADLGIDVYAAGLVHPPSELVEQDARGQRIAATCRSYVAFASFAGPTGGGYDATAGESTIWAPDGCVLSRATAAPDDMAIAELAQRPSRVTEPHPA